ncbi:hypothetical protein INH39_25515 [Massilia violaceinigra]|uniref:Phage antitermination protein Q n=1 Tax=Massilia violaceinigra TaxID=2045208 RepID=A0ABY4A3N5_9BURK|nr:hypothetical protein [Massilia violaceinigra]UOD28770.1 hypothetical protein INH39_25515 [Massilia violaceinigra]
MSARPTITLEWRGKADPVPDAGYVLAGPNIPAQPGIEPAPEYAAREIGLRLENWSRWATGGRGARGESSITGIICDAMREHDPATIGEARPTSRNPIDDNDALRIARAMIQLDKASRDLLRYCYIEQWRPEMICKVIGISIRPPTEFVARVFAAKAAIEVLANNQGVK